MKIVAIHGLPTSPRLWERLPIEVIAPALRGVATPEDRGDWSLESFVAEVLPLVDGDTVLVGHDLGGVIAAMCASRRRPRALVLSGTALGPYWAAVRLTAWPVLQRYFYEKYAGRRFLAGSVGEGARAAVAAAFPGLEPARMRAIAREMRPPPGLARSLKVPVRLVWGRDDRWYPPAVARAVARGCGASITWLPAGHLCMWEEPERFAAAVTGGW